MNPDAVAPLLVNKATSQAPRSEEQEAQSNLPVKVA
jgi:hypothetical protein